MENLNNLKGKRIVFFGTPGFTVEFLNLFKNLEIDIAYIVTGEDKPVGRGQLVHPPAPKLWTLPEGHQSGPTKPGFPEVLQPKKLDDDFYNFLKAEHEKQNFDLFIVIAYGKIIPERIINLPTKGTINLHYSLLPKYRGASPVESAILKGESETGITIQQMVYELDAGNILYQEKMMIDENETSSMLRERMNKRAIEIFPEFLVYIFSDRANPPSPSFGETKQDYTQATKCGKFSKADLDVTKDIQEKNLENIFTKYRAFDKKIYFFFQKGEQSIRVKITEMNYTGPTGVEITKVLPESRKEISLSDFENSFGKLHLE